MARVEWPNSLLFASIYGVVESASTALFGAVIGSWVDRLAYAKVMAVDPELLIHSDLKSRNFAAFISLVIRVNFSGAIGVLSTLAGTILIERDW
ncbi:hypothetical protein SAY86_029548 [Trapa natans]|uniref:Solute carrier family 40 member n=1 Tax=Trapa natans TaxID=22666 RepID=A0AAN7RC10_TRANT|nr:hypothetical protein SAY86_029548 [Trapa natans]